MASEHTVTKVLLEWINSFSLGKTLRTTDELTDGIILWEILQDIDPQYFLDELPERNPADHWVAKWQNLKHIHKLLISYIRHQNEDVVPAGLDPSPDLEAIAEKASVKETNKLLKLLLIAAISSPNAETFVQTLQSLSTPTQEGLKDIIEEAQNGEHESLGNLDEFKDTAAKRELPVDAELKFEERVGKVLAENDRLTHEKKELEKALEDLHNRLARLQENNDTLQNRLASTEDRLVTLKSGKGETGMNAKALESKARQQEDIIAQQEAKLSAALDEIDNLRMSVESLRVKNQRFQKLQDDYDELKTERDQLARKANAAEKYRQKLQANQDCEKENQTLRNRIEDLQQQLKEVDQQHKRSSERDVELEEYRKLLPRLEQDRHEIQNLKKQLEFNNHALTERLKSAEEQRERDDALISELRDRIRELEGSTRSPSMTPGRQTPRLQDSLQKDLEGLADGESELWVDSSSCGFPVLTPNSKSENGDVKKDGEELKRSPSSLDDSGKPYSEQYTSTAQLVQDKSIQNDDYWKLYAEFTELRKKLADFEDLNYSLRTKLESVKAELDLASKEKRDIINELKEKEDAELVQLRVENTTLTEKVHHLEAENDASLTLAREACTERDQLREMLDQKEMQMQAEDQEFLQVMQTLLAEFNGAASDGDQDASRKSPMDMLKQFAEIVEKSSERLAKRAEHIEQQNQMIKSLREQIKHWEERDSAEETISKERELELQRQIDNLDRELRLISSAFHDIHNRMQNSSITIPRYRHGGNNEMYKGWLGQQRHLLAGR